MAAHSQHRGQVEKVAWLGMPWLLPTSFFIISQWHALLPVLIMKIAPCDRQRVSCQRCFLSLISVFHYVPTVCE